MITRRGFLRRLGATLVLALLPARVLAKPRTVEMICRRAWGAEKPRGEFKRHTIKRMTVHHSAVLLTDNSEAPAHFRSHQQGHFGRGWPDIAYHVLVDRHGNVYEGRPMWAVPDTATNYDPKGHFTVMCEGNFQEQKPSKAQVAALVDVFAWASAEFDVAPRTIGGHQDYADTACPGANLERLITAGEIRSRVKAVLAGGGVELAEICGKEGKARVAAIEAGTD